MTPIIDDLKVAVKRGIQFSSANTAGYCERLFEGGTGDADRLITRLVCEYLGSADDGRRSIEEAINDDDVLWFLARFVERKAAEIRFSGRVANVEQALAAIAILGPNSDPRDVSLLLLPVYQAARDADVLDVQSIFERIGSAASSKWGVAE